MPPMPAKRREMDLSACANLSRNNESSLSQKYVSFKRKIRIYRKRLPTITFTPPRVNTFSANGTTAGFIPTTEVSTGISRSPTIRLIHFRLKSVGHILIMRFRYGMCMCIGGRVADNVGKNSRSIDRNEELSIGLLFYQRILSMILNYLISV